MTHARILAVPIAEREAVRAALLMELAQRLGRPCGVGYAGMAGAKSPGVLAPPGHGETTQAVAERVSRDGTEVAFLLDDSDGGEITLRDPWDASKSMRMRAQAGRTVQGRALPASRVVDERTYFPDPPVDSDHAARATPSTSQFPKA